MSRTFELAKTPRTLTIDASTGIPSFDGASIIMNADEAGTPSETVAFEVERGTSNNVSIRWNETSDKWQVTEDGTAYSNILTTADEGTGNGLDADTVDGIEAAAITQSGDSVELTGDVTGSTTVGADGAISISTTIAVEAVLGANTTGNYVQQGATSGNGISGSVNSEGGTFTVTSNATDANTASTIVFRDASGNFSASEVTATKIFTPTIDTTDSSAITITPPVNFNADVTAENDLQVNNHLTVGGNLTVQGTTTQVDSNVVNIGDNIITLNADEAGTPSQDAGIEVERGTSANVQVRWNETTDKWQVTEDGAVYSNILTTAGNYTINNDVTIGNELTVTTALFTPLIDTTDSSAITVTPAAIFSSDVSVQNDLVVTNKITATGVITGPTTDTLLIKNSAGTTLKTIRGV